MVLSNPKLLGDSFIVLTVLYSTVYCTHFFAKFYGKISAQLHTLIMYAAIHTITIYKQQS